MIVFLQGTTISLSGAHLTKFALFCLTRDLATFEKKSFTLPYFTVKVNSLLKLNNPLPDQFNYLQAVEK